METTSNAGGLSGLVETLLSGYIQVETLKNQTAGSNHGGDYPHVDTGVNNNGQTLVERQFVQGVSNSTLLAGVVGVLAVGGLVAALVFD